MPRKNILKLRYKTIFKFENNFIRLIRMFLFVRIRMFSSGYQNVLCLFPNYVKETEKLWWKLIC